MRIFRITTGKNNHAVVVYKLYEYTNDFYVAHYGYNTGGNNDYTAIYMSIGTTQHVFGGMYGIKWS